MRQTFCLQPIVDALLQGRLQRQPARLAPNLPGIQDVTQGYAVQSALLAGLRRAGHDTIGFKLGLTDTAAQTKLRTEGPLIGRLLQGNQYWDGDRIPRSAFIAPRVEAEVAFIIRDRLEDPELNAADLLRAVGGIVPALEICDSAIPGWPRSPWDALADNLCSGGFVLASQPAQPGIDLAEVTAELSINGSLRSSAQGRQCMGSPANACLWLARHLAQQGTPLQAGDIVLSGALGPMQEIDAGDEIRVRIAGLGELSCRFE